MSEFGKATAGRFVARAAGQGAGESRYAVWVPHVYEAGPGPLPVVLFLHGSGEGGTDGVAPTTVGSGPVLRGAPVAGVTMGGNGAWHLAIREPGRFAALVPVCGWLARESVAGADVALLAEGPYAAAAHLLRGTPTWVFHGAGDRVIPVDASRVMVGALREAGADVRYTEYPGAGHTSWRQAYADAAL